MSGHYGPNLMEEVRRFAIVGKYLATAENFDVIHAHDWMTFLAAVEAKKALEAAIEQSEALEADEDIDDVVDEELEVSETEEV